MGSRGWARQERKAKHEAKRQAESLPVPAALAPHLQFGAGNRLPVVQEPLTDLFSLDQERQI